jgi:hypothetical protein
MTSTPSRLTPRGAALPGDVQPSGLASAFRGRWRLATDAVMRHLWRRLLSNHVRTGRFTPGVVLIRSRTTKRRHLRGGRKPTDIKYQPLRSMFAPPVPSCVRRVP